MKKRQLLNVLLLISVACVASTAQAKSVNKPVAKHDKKILKKPSSVTKSRQMSEKDITECTQLINKVAQTDKTIQQEMAVTVANNSKIAEHLKKPAEVQAFASDDPVAIAHLTGKTASLPNLSSAKTMPSTPQKPTAKLAPLPIFKSTTATLVSNSKSVAPHVSKPVAKLPPNTQVFASDDPKAIAHLTGKITTPLNDSTAKNNTTKSITKQPVAKPDLFKSTTPPHPHIELFAPNTPDLNHLEGKSASLVEIQESTAIDKPVTTSQKTKASTHQSKKSSPAKAKK